MAEPAYPWELPPNLQLAYTDEDATIISELADLGIGDSCFSAQPRYLETPIPFIGGITMEEGSELEPWQLLVPTPPSPNNQINGSHQTEPAQDANDDRTIHHEVANEKLHGLDEDNLVVVNVWPIPVPADIHRQTPTNGIPNKLECEEPTGIKSSS